MKYFIPRTVILLGMVSFLNDTGSEMITPLLPLFLTATLGAGPAIVGLVEGLAEATASILKLVSGWLADRGWNAKKLVVGGYTVSNTSRPLICCRISILFAGFGNRSYCSHITRPLLEWHSVSKTCSSIPGHLDKE